MARFPDGFLWGVATAAHQVEGNNVANDAWLMEQLPGSIYREPSGDAVDFYHRYPDDIAVIAALGLNAFRFGVEWARVEPEMGQISAAELDHYSRVVDTCLRHGIEPVVTLHHFTSPQWLIRHNGGWRGPDTAARFADYAAVVMTRLGGSGVVGVHDQRGQRAGAAGRQRPATGFTDGQDGCVDGIGGQGLWRGRGRVLSVLSGRERR